MQTNPAVEQNKTLNGPLVREISPVGKEKVYGGNDLVKSQVLTTLHTLYDITLKLLKVYIVYIV